MATPIPANRARFTLAGLATAAGGTLVDLDPAATVEGVVTDSRLAAPGRAFVALRGEVYDGHRFAAAARDAGAVVLVERRAAIEGPRLEVDDGLAALAGIARGWVDRGFAADGPRPVLAIGGAAGKTTTKTLAAAAVAALFREPLVTAGNLNNRIGVPMTLLTLEPRHRAIVLECGTSVRGEIAALGALARPDVALVINVGVEHAEGLGTLEEIADEEAALLAAARRVAITAADEPLLVARLAGVAAPDRRTFGDGPDADARLVTREVAPDGTSRLRITTPEGDVEIATALPGATAAANLTAATAAALALLGRPATPDERTAVGVALGAVAPVPGRMAPIESAAGVLILDDSYNANPRSVAAAIDTAREVAARRSGTRPRARLHLALGDMLELGPFSASAHDEILAAADAAGAATLLLIGPEFAAAAARRPPATAHRLYGESAAAAREVASLVNPGDVLLVKGSRGLRTELLIPAVP